jgi:hypothetical protein
MNASHQLPAWSRYLLYVGGLGGVGVAVWWFLTRDDSGDGKPGPEVTPATAQAQGGPSGWAGSERVANRSVASALAAGARVTSRKRDDSATLRAGSTRGSDHHVGNPVAYAIDYGVRSDLAVGDRVFEAVRAVYGIPAEPGSYRRHEIVDGGERFSIQLLWRVKDHFDHVHLGVRRVDPPANIAGLSGLGPPRSSPLLGLL